MWIHNKELPFKLDIPIWLNKRREKEEYADFYGINQTTVKYLESALAC